MISEKEGKSIRKDLYAIVKDYGLVETLSQVTVVVAECTVDARPLIEAHQGKKIYALLDKLMEELRMMQTTAAKKTRKRTSAVKVRAAAKKATRKKAA